MINYNELVIRQWPDMKLLRISCGRQYYELVFGQDVVGYRIEADNDLDAMEQARLLAWKFLARSAH